MCVRPVIGIRAKLTTRHGGHWGSTSGDRAKARRGRAQPRRAVPLPAVRLLPQGPTTLNMHLPPSKKQFGLRAREIVAVVNALAEEGMLDCLQLLHFHCGSQITNIRMASPVEGVALAARMGWLPTGLLLPQERQ